MIIKVYSLFIIKKNPLYTITLLKGLFNGFRLLPGPINVIFLMSKGVELSTIPYIQLVFTISSFITSHPLGKISFFFRRKIAVFFSLLCIITYYYLYLKAPDIRFIVLGQIFLSISLNLMDISITSWLTIEAEKKSTDKDIDYFFYLENQISSLSGFLISMAFIFLAYVFKNNTIFYELIYILSTMLMISLIALLIFIPDHNKNYLTINQLKKEHNFVSNKNLLLHCIIFVVTSSAIWVAYQPLFHYWQLMLLSKDTVLPKDSYLIKNSILGVSFLIMHIFVFFSNQKIHKLLSLYNHSNVAAYTTLIASLMFWLIGFSNNLFLVIICFCTLHGCMSILWKLNRGIFLKICKIDSSNKWLLIAQTFCRFVSAIILTYSMFYINTVNDINTLYYFCSVVLFVLSLIYVCWKYL